LDETVGILEFVDCEDFKLFVVDAIDAGLDLFDDGLVDVFEAVEHHILVKVKLIIFWILWRHNILEMLSTRRDVKEL